MSKRDTFITGPRSTYRVQSPEVEAAKFLRGQLSRFIKGAANISDIEIAITEWKGAIANRKLA